MIKDEEYLKSKASFCLDLAKKLGATDASVTVGNSISETVSFRNKVLDESNRSDSLAISIETYLGKKKSSITSSNLLDENLKTLIEKCFETTKITPDDEFNSLPDKELLAKNEKLVGDLNVANEKFNKVNASGERRDIGNLAVNKPKSIQIIEGRREKQRARCFEIAQGSPLTEEELNATKKSQINAECPNIANPNYVPY